MRTQFDVLIVEDDFYIAEITKEFVTTQEGFSVVGTCRTGEEALRFLGSVANLPHLLLLDVYIPDVKGLSLFWEIRKNYPMVDVIMMTAANEVITIEEALRGGIFDYIVKPLDYNRLEKTLTRYKGQRKLLASKSKMLQDDIDRLTGVTKESIHINPELPKGIDPLTLDMIRTIFYDDRAIGMTAVEVGQKIGASRSTARRYLEYLTTIQELEAKLSYGEVGRPERRYFREQNEQN